jgi:hypothetical protein
MSDPNNLEGNPPTPEERAAMARELDWVAPSPGDKFALMFGQRPTPRTDALKAEYLKSSPVPWTALKACETLERELAEAREQRDRLAEALRACREDSCELLGERYWWADEPRCDYRKRYDETAENIVKADEALDALNPHSASTSPSTADGDPPPPCPV